MPRQRRNLPGLGLRLRQIADLLLLRFERLERCDPDNGAVDDVAEAVGFENDVERLVPGNVAQRHVDGAVHARIDDDVEAADLGEGAQHGAEVGALEVEADGVAGELTSGPRGARLRGRRLQHGRGGHRRRRRWLPAGGRRRDRSRAGRDDVRRRRRRWAAGWRVQAKRRDRIRDPEVRQRHHRVGRPAVVGGRRHHVRRGLHGRPVEIDDQCIPIAAHVMRDRLRQRNPHAGRRGAHGFGGFDRDVGDRAPRVRDHRVGHVVGRDVAEVEQQRERIGPRRGIRDRLARFDHERRPLRAHASADGLQPHRADGGVRH